MIDSFSGQNRFLSNFYPSSVQMGIVVYPTAEHAFQAMKMTNERDRLAVWNAATPGKAKRIARLLDRRPDWETTKVNVMEQVVLRKFEQNEELRARLLNTGDRFIVEGNYWHDTFWGVCEGRGRNMLGHILMTVRSRLV